MPSCAANKAGSRVATIKQINGLRLSQAVVFGTYSLPLRASSGKMGRERVDCSFMADAVRNVACASPGPEHSTVLTIQDNRATATYTGRNVIASWSRGRARSVASVIGFALVTLAASGQPAPEPAKTTKPRVYALIAAVGEQFTEVMEVPRTGTHLPPYRRSSTQVNNNILNRLVLYSLDRAVAKIDPGSQRVYLSLPAAQMDGVTPMQRESVAISRVVAELQQMPQRLEWDRILIVTPAYRTLELNGLAGKMQGFGLFNESQCQGCGGIGPNALTQPTELFGPEALSSEDKTVHADTYLAPFSYIEVWILDAKTLEVLDQQQGFDSQKLAEPSYKEPLDLTKTKFQEYMASRLSSMVQLSVTQAVTRSELSWLGRVEVGPVKEVNPEDVKK